MRVAAGEAGAGGDPHLATVAHLHRRSGDVIGPKVKGAAARDVEAGVMPMAGQDVVLHRAAVQGKAQMRAAVVQSEDPFLVIDDEQRAVLAGHHHHALRPELLERAYPDEGAIDVVANGSDHGCTSPLAPALLRL